MRQARTAAFGTYFAITAKKKLIDMKKIVAIIFALIATVSVYAQNDAETLWSELKKQGQVSMEFTLRGTDPDGVVVSADEGKVCLQGDCYRIECGDMLICCDGKTMWLYNQASEELVIDRDEAMPFMKATNVRKDQQGNINATYVADDITFKVKVSGITPAATPWPASHFVIDVDSLSDDVIVTDLRD